MTNSRDTPKTSAFLQKGNRTLIRWTRISISWENSRSHRCDPLPMPPWYKAIRGTAKTNIDQLLTSNWLSWKPPTYGPRWLGDDRPKDRHPSRLSPRMLTSHNSPLCTRINSASDVDERRPRASSSTNDITTLGSPSDRCKSSPSRPSSPSPSTRG